MDFLILFFIILSFKCFSCVRESQPASLSSPYYKGLSSYQEDIVLPIDSLEVQPVLEFMRIRYRSLFQEYHVQSIQFQEIVRQDLTHVTGQMVTFRLRTTDQPLRFGCLYFIQAHLSLSQSPEGEVSVLLSNSTVFQDFDTPTLALTEHTAIPLGDPKPSGNTLFDLFSFFSAQKSSSFVSSLSILCYNIWNYNENWKSRQLIITQQIKELQPSIIAWQEMRYRFPPEAFQILKNMENQEKEAVDTIIQRGIQRFQHLEIHAQLEKDYQHFVYQPVMTYLQVASNGLHEDEGLSIFSKHPIIESSFKRFYFSPSDDDNHRGCLRTKILIPSFGPIDLYTSHFSLSGKMRKLNVVELWRWIKEQHEVDPTTPQILMGDFNEEDDGEAMNFLLGSLELEGERADFIDVWKYFQPLSSGFTFTSWSPHKRIDFVLVRSLFFTPPDPTNFPPIPPPILISETNSASISVANISIIRPPLNIGELKQSTAPSDHFALLVELIGERRPTEQKQEL